MLQILLSLNIIIIFYIVTTGLPFINLPFIMTLKQLTVMQYISKPIWICVNLRKSLLNLRK